MTTRAPWIDAVLLGLQANQRGARFDHDPGEHCAVEVQLSFLSHQRTLLSLSAPDRACPHPERVFVSSGTSGLDHGGCRSAPGPSTPPLIANGGFSELLGFAEIQTVAAFAPTAGSRERLERFDRGLQTQNLPELGLTALPQEALHCCTF